MKKLARLEKIDLREIWKHEALDFTQWLAQKENIDLLCDELGINIENIKTEAAAGRYSRYTKSCRILKKILCVFCHGIMFILIQME